MGFFSPRAPSAHHPCEVDLPVAVRRPAVDRLAVNWRPVAGTTIDAPRVASPAGEPLRQFAIMAEAFLANATNSLAADAFVLERARVESLPLIHGLLPCEQVDFIPRCAAVPYRGVPLAFQSQLVSVAIRQFSEVSVEEISVSFLILSTWLDGLDWPTSDSLTSSPCEVVSPAFPRTQAIDVSIPEPEVRGRVYVRFAPIPLEEAAEQARTEAGRTRPPDDDPFAALFYLLLAKRNWDIRVKGLEALLAAYPEGKRPFTFQFEGINFLVKRNTALLSDEMGLGKTIQAILAMRTKIHAGELQRVLIACPKSLLQNWFSEVSEWAPELSTQVVHGFGKEAAIRLPYHVYISNYESVVRLVCDDNLRHRREIKPFDLLIVDEAQNLKNPATQKAKAFANIRATQRWALTGTPLENKFADYRAIWKLIAPQSPIHKLNDPQFLTTTKSDTLRREKIAVLEDLPEKIVGVHFVELEGRQWLNYSRLEQEAQNDAQSKSDTETRKLRTYVLALLTKLKQACIVDAESGESAKMEWLEERLEEMHPNGKHARDCEKALVFTQYPQLVCDRWKLPDRVRSYQPIRYDGTLSDADRHRFTKLFQEDETPRVAFVGLKAGGTGLTLTRANHVVFLDQWWNPAVMEQAAARIHRIGQKRTCYVTTLIARNTVDERIMKILQRKKDLFARVAAEIAAGKTNEADMQGLEEALTLDELMEALGLPRKSR